MISFNPEISDNNIKDGVNNILSNLVQATFLTSSF